MVCFRGNVCILTVKFLNKLWQQQWQSVLCLKFMIQRSRVLHQNIVVIVGGCPQLLCVHGASLWIGVHTEKLLMAPHTFFSASLGLWGSGPSLHSKVRHTYGQKCCQQYKGQAPMAHACNSSYSGGRDQEDHGSKPVGQTEFRTPYLKKTHHKRRASGLLKI
jgi:hypothetical protein